MKYFCSFMILSFGLICSGYAKTIEVDSMNPEHSLQWAVSQAVAGDTILLLPGNHISGQYVSNLHGTEVNPIVIIAKGAEPTIFNGGNQAIHFSDVSYLIIVGIQFNEQTINGVNIDDGGDYDTPTHHIEFRACKWSDLNAVGNNDQLKMSGVDYFSISNCSFVNGSPGGSMVDMVGCHHGTFEMNTFTNGGSNSIQAKGGTSDIIITRNSFTDGGQRAINCGGSTGLPYFRPIDADYEAKGIRIFSNIFTGSIAPIAFVGSIESEFINNTIYKPGRWIARVLQENTDERFVKCSYNTFANNICYFDNNAAHEQGINIGTNTLPETFTYTNNLWFNIDNPNWNGPNSAFSHQETITNKDPKLGNPDAGDFELGSDSPAISKGMSFEGITSDFEGNHFNNPPSMGAIEFKGIINSLAGQYDRQGLMQIAPNPATDYIEVSFEGVMLSEAKEPAVNVKVFDVLGVEVLKATTPSLRDTPPKLGGESIRLDISSLSPGVYFVKVGERVSKFVKM